MSLTGTILNVISVNEICKLDSFVYKEFTTQSVLIDASLDRSVIMFVVSGNVDVSSNDKLPYSQISKKVIILPHGSRAELSFSVGATVITFGFLDYLDLSPATIAAMQLFDPEKDDVVPSLDIPPYISIILKEVRAFVSDREINDVVHRVYFVKVIKLLEKCYGSKIFAAFLSPIVCARYKMVEKYQKRLQQSEKNGKKLLKIQL